MTARGARRRRRLLVTLVSLAVLVTAGVLVVRRLDLGPPLVPECTATATGQSTSVDPDQADSAATITAVAVGRRLPARAATIAIATALQESKLRNLPYGDRDSLGLFQQRPSQGWGTAAQIRDPVHASNAFYDALVKVDGWQHMQITEIAQQVQRSGFPDAYAAKEARARLLASALAGFSPAGLTCVLPGAPQGGTVGAVRASLAREYGGRVSARAAGADGLRVPAGDSTLAWSVAAWAVARADSLSISQVSVDGRTWRRDRPRTGWRADQHAPARGAGVQISVSVAARR